jgi:hypothetical protein
MFIADKVYSIVGVKLGDPLPSHTSIGCYPIVYVSKRGEPRCSECATNNDNDWNPTNDAGIHWEGKSHSCEDCGCYIESAYG